MSVVVLFPQQIYLRSDCSLQWCKVIITMPHVSSGGGGDDLGSTDEVKVFKDEGEDEKRSSENLTEEKSSLIDLTESEVCEPVLPVNSAYQASHDDVVFVSCVSRSLSMFVFVIITCCGTVVGEGKFKKMVIFPSPHI